MLFIKLVKLLKSAEVKVIPKPAKREVVFVRLLETIAPKDAKLVLEMKTRSIKGVSSNVVQKAFPQITVS